ncbi:MAG: S8 family serine peptidase, partial [Verrucomicrobiota bacterium]
MSHRSWSLFSLIIAIGLLAGWWLGRSATDLGPDQPDVTERDRPVSRQNSVELVKKPKVKLRPSGTAPVDAEALEAGAIPGERWVSFGDRAALERFLNSLNGRGVVLDSIDALNTLRLRITDPSALDDLLAEAEDSGLIYPVDVPDVGTIQDDAVGFGRDLLSWLGIDAQNRAGGEGVKVAVLDTGVASHSVFSDNVTRTNLIELPDDPATLNGHGTAVASLIASQIGLAPDASILSYRVADDNGSSDSFTLAQGVIAAADAGADIINISMGSSGDSSVLRKAVEYAQQSGSLIVASAGNEGQSQVAYPAAYDGVVSVGAVDALGNHLNFSNSGDVTLSAPGLEVLSAYPGDQAVLFTGTSGS